MALNRQIARLAKILVESENITYGQAQERLESLTLEIVIGPDTVSPAANAAALTAISVGRRTFLGGVRVRGATELPLNTALPLRCDTIGAAARKLRCCDFEGAAAQTIHIGIPSDVAERPCVSAYWDGWHAGVAPGAFAISGDGSNPLAGIAAGALAVGAAFQDARGIVLQQPQELDLWADGRMAPNFSEVFLPDALWLIGLGNLGQAILWGLSTLPYADPKKVSVILQDSDRIKEENWGTSVLVQEENYGALKTKVGEAWCEARGFDVRRVDRMHMASDRLSVNDPQTAISGVDKIDARKRMADMGFACIVDVGLGRTANQFDLYRVSIFDKARRIDQHFSGLSDPLIAAEGDVGEAYKALEAEIGRCGAAEIAGASVAAPYVSAVAAAVALSRAIAIASGCACPSNEVGRISSIQARRLSPPAAVQTRGVGHAGKPLLF